MLLSQGRKQYGQTELCGSCESGLLCIDTHKTGINAEKVRKLSLDAKMELFMGDLPEVEMLAFEATSLQYQ